MVTYVVVLLMQLQTEYLIFTLFKMLLLSVYYILFTLIQTQYKWNQANIQEVEILYICFNLSLH